VGATGLEPAISCSIAGVLTGSGFSTIAVSMFCGLQLKSVPARIASYATHGAGAMVLVNVMRIPCFGRRMTIGRASMVCPGAS
jgi:hypothetical protein